VIAFGLSVWSMLFNPAANSALAAPVENDDQPIAARQPASGTW
jgi:hypothetical protein